MLKRVDPLRRELKELEEQAEHSRLKAEEINRIINELEQSIARYKEEYALLISQANTIRADLSTVEAKVPEILMVLGLRLRHRYIKGLL